MARRTRKTKAAATAATMRAFAYCRVSSARQATDGDSLPVQIAMLQAAAAAEGLELVEVFIEQGISGSVPLADRPQGSRLMAAVQPGDTVMCLKLDRLSRNTTDALAVLESVKARGVRLWLRDMGGMVTGSVGEMVFTMLASVAKFERSRNSERVSEVVAKLKAEKRRTGGSVPFGQRVVIRDGRQYLEPVEEVITTLRTLKAQGYSSRLAAGHMASLGYPCSHSAVQSAWSSIEG